MSAARGCHGAPLVCTIVHAKVLKGVACLVLLLAHTPNASTPSSQPLVALLTNNTVRGMSPYDPKIPNEPWSDIDCDSLACDGNSEHCADWPTRVCSSYKPCKHQVCLHKTLWPVLKEDAVSFVAVLLIAVLAGCAGIGGGGLVVPILMILNRFDIKEAVPLSHVAVMGNALSQLAVNTRQAHPTVPHRPLIHYEMALLLLPAMLGGNSIGVVVGRVFPPTLLVVLSLVLLAVAASKTAAKGLHTMREAKAAREAKLLQRCRSGPAPPSLPGGAGLPLTPRTASGAHALHSSPSARRPDVAAAAANSAWPTPPPPSAGNRTPTGNWPLVHHDSDRNLGSPPASVQIFRSWSGNFCVSVPCGGEFAAQTPSPGSSEETDAPRMRIPWRVIALMVAFNLVTCADFLGMSKDVFHVEQCSLAYWVFFIGLYPFILAAILLGVRYLQALRRWHDQRGDGPIPGDPPVDGKTVVLFPVLAVAVGLMAGLLGLGGGEFMVPLLLEFGLLARMASATSGFLIFFSTSSNIVHYALTGTLEPFMGYAISYFFLAMLGALLGLKARDSRYAREHSYLVVFLLAALLICSGVLLAVRGLVNANVDWRFGSFCGAA